MMKKYIILFIAGVTLLPFLNSCNDDLTEKLEGSLSVSTLTEGIHAEALVDGCYQVFIQNGYGFFCADYVKLVDGITDAFVIHNGGGEKFRWNENIANSLWRQGYSMVERTNTALELIEGMDDANFEDVSVKQRLIGELKFLRAFTYSLLSSSFGDIPLLIGQVDPLPARDPLADVIAQIKLDIADAMEVLPWDYNSGDFGSASGEVGRASKGAAYTLLAKIYLREGNYAKAKEALDDIIGSDAHSLFQGLYGQLWMESNRNHNEFIFAIKSHGEDYGTASNHHIKVFSPWGYDLGWANVGVPAEIFYAMDENDERSSVIVNDLSGAYYGYVQNYGTAIEGWKGWAIFSKYSGNNRDVTAPGQPWGNYGSSKLNVPFYRYADILLLSAEVENRLNNGPTTLAYERLNAVRQRANASLIPEGLSEAQFNDAVLLERAIELTGEGHRREDLIRHGKFEANINAYLATRDYIDAQTVVEAHKLFPIPRQELDINENMTPNPSNALANF